MTLNQLIILYKDIAARHEMVNSFEVAQDFNIGADDTITYPILVVNPTGANLPRTIGGYTSFKTTFELQVIDLVNKDNDNRLDVLSDTQQIINDVVNEFNTHPYYADSGIDTIGDISFTPLKGVYVDDVDGWKITMELEHPNKLSYCGNPIENLSGFDFSPAKSIVSNSTDNYLEELYAGQNLELPDNTIVVTNDVDTVLSTTYNPVYDDITIEVPIATAVKSGIAYKRPSFTGQEVSYATGDDGYHLINGTYDYTPPTDPLTIAALDLAALNPFTTLQGNNSFGNLERFTDELGTQVYSSEYVIDNLTGLGWSRIQGLNNNWNNKISDANSSTANGYDDWRLCNSKEMESIVDYSASKGLNYPPINGSSSRFYWLSTTSGRNSVTAIRYANATAIYYTSTSKSITDGYSYICRNHFN